MNNIKHIGLTVCEKDVKYFYEEILDFKAKNNFILTQENAIAIFNIPTATKVIAGECPEMELELFIIENQSNLKIDTFNHVCFFTDRLNDIASKAKQNGYKIFILQHSETLFLTDSNQNIFEIKQLI
jgi:catechol-2,3-dioxygenase